jgi:hypothetical protein
MKFIILFFIGLNFTCHADIPTRHIRSFHNYKVIIDEMSEETEGQIKVFLKGKLIFHQKDFNSYYFGNSQNFKLPHEDLYSGKDITGNNIPNLVISEWTGGNRCCASLYIFEIGKKFKKIFSLDEISYGIELIDIDRDKIPEIVFHDAPIDYRFSSGAGSAQGKTILKLHKDSYIVASHLMMKPFPEYNKLAKILKIIKSDFLNEDNPDLPYSFLKFMMDLSYSGHIWKALKIAEEVWPQNKPGLTQFKKDFQLSLFNSHYFREFMMNRFKKL